MLTAWSIQHCQWVTVTEYKNLEYPALKCIRLADGKLVWLAPCFLTDIHFTEEN